MRHFRPNHQRRETNHVSNVVGYRYPQGVAVRALLGVLFTLLLCACSNRSDELPEFLSSLPPELARHLIASDDSTLVRFGREAGFDLLVYAIWDLEQYGATVDLNTYKRCASQLMNCQRRIALILHSEYHFGMSLEHQEFMEGLSPERRVTLTKLRRELISIFADTSLTISDKIEKAQRYKRELETHDDVFWLPMSLNLLANLYSNIGDEEAEWRYRRAAYEGFKALGPNPMTCQLLGVFGAHYESVGKIDSMVICYDEALEIAQQIRAPHQVGRIKTFYAAHYGRLGRLSLAHDLYTQAMDLCREYKGRYIEIRFVVDAMRFYARLGCWQIVERLLRRLHVLQHKYEEELDGIATVYLLRGDLLEARMLMARGDVLGAEAIMNRIRDPIEVLPYRTEQPSLLYYWAVGLVDNGHAVRALEIIEKGYQRSVGARLPRMTARFALLRARAELQAGRLGDASASIGQFDELSHGNEQVLRRELVWRDALLGRVALESGNTDSAWRTLEEGMERLRMTLSHMDASAHSYLWLGACEVLRQLMQDLTAGDPHLGYGAELYWRDFYRWIGNNADNGPGPASVGDGAKLGGRGRLVPSGASLAERFRLRASATTARVMELNAVHSVYVVRHDSLWCWTNSQGTIRRDVIGASVEEVREHISGAWSLLSTDPGDETDHVPAQLVDDLRRLARWLLPHEVRDTGHGAPRLFLVSSDGFLNRVPFETFDVGERDEYIPLLANWDVAYLRHAEAVSGFEDRSELQTSAGIILVGTKPSRELQRRYPLPRLKEAAAEGWAVAGLYPGATLFEGKHATKANLESTWQNAEIIYLAVHTLRDPQVPYLMLIPVAQPDAHQGPDANYLDIADIRAADMSRCRVVFMSGCSTGAPYTDSVAEGPSLGDAFLDAGASAVVQTFWDVRDDTAREQMTQFLQRWRNRGALPIQALNDSRREMLYGSRHVRHPFIWAAYAIAIGGL
ncbi:MAG: CHAT domain-containing protein [Candidatus Latescibacteria bacterium]|nr:CHAT domain-containing protein [Candidatus Latescibacterota bacterium]NIM65789.1 CHAT domain-containing protein [Candidatus Latescibacterota bacterium]NIO02282.1 CHAT domain-containing protein [Candidatus Latescibacterota bacterium]NIO29153.1 CHAT domain-containing protein [Candidatus Latescibacterota bacterium]NIO56767.1 CHAT domain-containing protein [Candidatus Latescibacterota bacterium]